VASVTAPSGYADHYRLPIFAQVSLVCWKMMGPSFHSSSLEHQAFGHFCHQPAVVCQENYVLETYQGLFHEPLDCIHFWCLATAAFQTDLTMTLYQQNQLEYLLDPS